MSAALAWTVVMQGALRDDDLPAVAQHCDAETVRQISWLETRVEVAAPQAQVVAP